MGLISLVPIVGSFASGIIVPQIYTEYNSFFETFKFGVYICFFCLLLVIIMVILDKIADKHDDIILTKYIEEQKRLLGIPVSPNTGRKTNTDKSATRLTTFYSTTNSED